MKLLHVLCVVMVIEGAGAIDCPTEYIGYKSSERCFYIHPTEISFTEATIQCAQEANGHVIRIKTETDESIAAALLATDTKALWNGLIDDNGNGTYLYTDGSSLGDYAPWQPAPSSAPFQMCGTSHNAGEYWQSRPCNLNAWLICEWTPELTSCDAHWTHNPDANTCIRAIRGRRRTYTGASSYCKGLGGELATKVTTLTERKRIMSLMKFQGHFLIGVDDKDNDGTYEYIDGTALGSQKPFRKGRAFAGRCVTIKRRRWYPKSCTRKLFFICEKAARQ